MVQAYINQNVVPAAELKEEIKKTIGREAEFLIRLVILPRDDVSVSVFLRASPISALALSAMAAARGVGSNSPQVNTTMNTVSTTVNPKIHSEQPEADTHTCVDTVTMSSTRPRET